MINSHILDYKIRAQQHLSIQMNNFGEINAIDSVILRCSFPGQVSPVRSSSSADSKRRFVIRMFDTFFSMKYSVTGLLLLVQNYDINEVQKQGLMVTQRPPVGAHKYILYIIHISEELIKIYLIRSMDKNTCVLIQAHHQVKCVRSRLLIFGSD